MFCVHELPSKRIFSTQTIDSPLDENGADNAASAAANEIPISPK